MRGLTIAVFVGIFTLSACGESQPQAPVAEPSSDAPAAAVEQPASSETIASPIVEPAGEAPPIAVVDPVSVATTAPPPVAAPVVEPPPAAVAQPAPVPANPVAATTATRPSAVPPVLAQADAPAAPSSEPPAAPSPATAAAPPPEESLPPAAAPVAATTPAPPPTAQELDLAGLEQRLRETRAIGVFTKLSIKNQVDDLLNQFRGFYQGRIKVQLEELRERYELLMFKVLTLLQDADRELAQAITASREAIWGILSDPQKLATI